MNNERYGANGCAVSCISCSVMYMNLLVLLRASVIDSPIVGIQLGRLSEPKAEHEIEGPLGPG